MVRGTANRLEDMEEKVILLNGGRDHEVESLASADMYLMRLLGAEAARRAVVYLRVTQDDVGAERVSVFVGSQQVGRLPATVDQGLTATVKACAAHGAVARARGTMTASWDQPGRVKVKVDLADPEHLLSAAAPAPQAPQTAEYAPPPPAMVPAEPVVRAEAAPAAAYLLSADQTTREPLDPGHAFTLSASLEDAVAFMDMDGVAAATPRPKSSAGLLVSSSAPGLASGWTEDYPDWPPKKPEPIAPAVPETPSEDTTGNL
jgi:hypothetical protein